MKNKLFRITLITTGMALVLSACAAPAKNPVNDTGQTNAVLLGGRLLFSQFIESTHTFDGMFASLPDGSGETSVPLPGPEGGGRWSRSGTEIAVMTILADNRIGTAIIAPDGKVLRTFEIPDPTLNLVCTVWSRDDTRLACQAWDDVNPSRAGIFTVRSSDGGDLQRVTTAPEGMIEEPGDYSPDGQIVFVRVTGSEPPGMLMLVDGKGGEPRSLSKGLMEDIGRFSPDGLSVLTSANGHILVIDLNGTILHDISFDGKYLFGPVWSPDGNYIAFSMDEVIKGPFADIYTSKPDGTDLLQVTNTPANEITVDWGANDG